MMQARLCFSVVTLLSLALAGCANRPTANDALPSDASARAMALAQTKTDLTNPQKKMAQPMIAAAPQPALPVLRGLGMAQISRQPGGSINEKRLLAIRAARLDAIRDLTEQVHGVRLSSETTVRDSVVKNDSLRALVAGEIRGARTERITPEGNDAYEVILSLDPDVVAYIARAAALGV